MKSILNTLLLSSFAILTSAGCIPEKRIVWTSDGMTAAVSTDNGLFFIDGEGRVLPPRLPGKMTRCAWFKDSRRIAVVHVVPAANWQSLESFFNEKQTIEIHEHAKTLRERVLAYNGDWDKFDSNPDKKLSPGFESAVFMYLRDKDATGLPEKLGAKWDDLKKAEVNIWSLQVFELAADRLVPGKILHRSLDEISQPKISPRQTAITMEAINSDSGASDTPSLYAVSLSSGGARMIAANVALDYDWSSDGQNVALIRASGNSTDKEHALQLGSLTTIQVADANGELLKEWGPVTDRVGLIFSPVAGVRWLSDGRIIFSAAEVTLPATTRDMPQQSSLFVLDPRMPAGVARALGRDFTEQLDPSMSLFEVSPDEESVLLHGPKGHVILYHFREGKATTIQGDDDPDGGLRSIATWKNKDEICLVGAAHDSGAGKKAADVLIYKAGKSRVISGSWPSEMKEGWLTSNK